MTSLIGTDVWMCALRALVRVLEPPGSPMSRRTGSHKRGDPAVIQAIFRDLDSIK
jgi:hypothetical protein